jgi:hypothetical protein
MNCPLFEDYTRGCVSKYPDFVIYSNFDICGSAEYQKCPMFIVINSKFKCQYLPTCSHSYNVSAPKLIEKIFLDEKFKNDIIMSLVKKYCISDDNSRNCARYKLISQGEKPPLTLLPDDTKIHFIDLLLKKKIMISP